MRQLLMVLAGVVILYLSSIIYRDKVTPITTHFPVKSLGEEIRGEIQLNLVLFFSMNNCRPCLKVIDFLNHPPDGVRVAGIVPEKEMQLVNEIRQTTGAGFPIYSFKGGEDTIPIMRQLSWESGLTVYSPMRGSGGDLFIRIFS